MQTDVTGERVWGWGKQQALNKCLLNTLEERSFRVGSRSRQGINSRWVHQRKGLWSSLRMENNKALNKCFLDPLEEKDLGEILKMSHTQRLKNAHGTHLSKTLLRKGFGDRAYTRHLVNVF